MNVMIRALLFNAVLVCLAMVSSIVHAEEIKIGVLSHRGDESTLRNWSPTADYLTQHVNGHEFFIEPLDFSEIDRSVAEKQIDFLLVNPAIYVAMEVKHRISRIATMNNLVGDESVNIFGGVIFTAADNHQINRLEDIAGHSFMAVDKTSLGGFHMAWREMKEAGIDVPEDLAALQFGGIHDAVVNAVITGRVDVGTVRSGILNSMAEAGTVDLAQIKILNRRQDDDFPLPVSTRLYPEWPFSKLQHTPNDLAQRVAIALLEMNGLDVAAQWGEYDGWTVPLEYQPVHDLLRELSLPPYNQGKRFTLADVVSRYYPWLLVVMTLIIILSAMTAFIYRLHRRLEESKHLLEQHHVQILDSVADGIYGVDLKGNSTFVNKAMEDITGWNAAEIIGLNQHEILHHTRFDGSPHPSEECPVYKTFHENKPRFVEEDLFWRKDGSSFPVEYSSNPVRDENGRVVGSVVVFRDISQKKQAQEEARQYQMELAHVARLSNMGEMASGLAHELNQPLTAIATNADACIRFLESGQNPARISEVLEKISAQARHAGEVIKHLRRFVRKEEPELVETDVNRLIREVLVLVKAELVRAAVREEIHLGQNLPLVLAQPIHIDQVLLNLVRNAIDSLRDNAQNNRRLYISSAKTDSGHIIVRVFDNGPGVKPAIARNLFTPFKTTKEHGMGLGLSLSQGIIAAHGGQLKAESIRPGNTVFSFSLPIADGDNSNGS